MLASFEQVRQNVQRRWITPKRMKKARKRILHALTCLCRNETIYCSNVGESAKDLMREQAYYKARRIWLSFLTLRKEAGLPNPLLNIICGQYLFLLKE